MPYKHKEVEQKYFTQSEVANNTGEHLETVRFWVDNIGIQFKKGKHDRLFTREQVKQIERVIKWKDRGISLKTIIKEQAHLKDEITMSIDR